MDGGKRRLKSQLLIIISRSFYHQRCIIADCNSVKREAITELVGVALFL